ncbi:MAG: bifunctional 5,10-methylenetetrahydrofolate dehydrogenase/5,10-methenyltetrahydrofolate cyclohydrolase [bacterium]|nr:bifunctional 5,10-methylenetetrahydrofolate dehydrogenase/5,10-methenyltetrahydrofolate cyclohydrolase [bacterium]
MKIDGREIAGEIFEKLKREVEELKKKNIIPHLAIILVGDDPASKAYVGQKELKATEIDAKATVINLKSEIQNSELIKLIEKLNNDNSVHGIIIQRPLPPQIDSKDVDLATDIKKDIDAFREDAPFPMPIVCAVLKILEEIHKTKSEIRNPKSETNSNNQNSNRSVSSFDIRHSNFYSWLQSENIVVIGKGETGGKPIIETFKKMGIEPNVIDSKTKNPQDIKKNADIIISAVGKLNVVKKEEIKKGVILLSIGLHKKKDGKLHGDYEEEEIKEIASFYTPTPGGIGPVNVACLLENLIRASAKTSY